MTMVQQKATFTDGTIEKGTTLYKISFATVCMNRLHHIRQTLPKNIEDNKQYENVEFILLDYNSTDGLEDWVRENMQEHIQSGKLIFYRTTEPEYFKRSHSRNMAMRLCEGDIICNVDADNYTGNGFAEYINKKFNKTKNIFLAGSFSEQFMEYKDSYGRFCAWKDDFIKIGGYDEEMESYGHEDTDLYERFGRYGRIEVNIGQIQYLHSISHSDQERTGNEFFRKNILKFYMTYLGNGRRVLFLYRNGMFEMGTLVENYYSLPSPSAIQEQGWLKGKWEEDHNELRLTFEDNTAHSMYTDNDRANYMSNEKEGKLLYSHVTNSTLLYNMMLSYSIITNSNRIHLNETKNKIKVNESIGGFGKGIVYKNFDNTNKQIIG
jgi:GT2 family glycosyltransferase